MAHGPQDSVCPLAEKFLAPYSGVVERFAATIGAVAEAHASNLPDFPFRVIYQGDAAHILIRNRELGDRPVIRAIVCWGDRRYAERAWCSIFNQYLGFIVRDPESVEFSSNEAPVMPTTLPFMCELASPELSMLSIDEGDIAQLRALLHRLAFCVIRSGYIHRRAALAAGDPNREFVD